MSDIVFFENVLIKFLFTDEKIRDKAIPFLVPELFEDHKNIQLIKSILKLNEKLERFPTVSEMRLDLDKEDVYKRLMEIMGSDVSEYKTDFLLEAIEEYIREKLIHNVNIDIAMKLSNDKVDEIKESPDKLREAIAFSFDSKIGLDFLEEEERLYNFLHDKDRVVQTGIKELNKIIEGGWHEKSLSLFMAECVAEDTLVDVRYKVKKDKDWKYLTTNIYRIQHMLNDYEIEVNSPDGYVKVNEYVEKGRKRLYKIKIGRRELFASKFHFFETDKEWKTVSYLMEHIGECKILCEDGKFKDYEIEDINVYGNVVDLSVNHKNHRYYTNGLSSHNTNMGKSLIMASAAVDSILNNKNVLYITCEMSENKISERVMSNLFDISIGDLRLLTKEKFHKKFESIKKQLKNKLVIKEYPPRAINSNHIRNLLKELKVRKKFHPDIIFVDYLGIMNPTTRNKGDNTYLEIKRISEEVRALAVDMGIPIVSAVQSGRQSFGSAEIDLKDISDSIGIAATADVIIGVTQSEELRNLGKYNWIILKNRYGLNKKKVSVCVDYYKMRVYDDEEAEVEGTASSITKDPPSQKDKDNKKNAAVNDVLSVIKKDDDNKRKKYLFE